MEECYEFTPCSPSWTSDGGRHVHGAPMAGTSHCGPAQRECFGWWQWTNLAFFADQTNQPGGLPRGDRRLPQHRIDVGVHLVRKPWAGVFQEPLRHCGRYAPLSEQRSKGLSQNLECQAGEFDVRACAVPLLWAEPVSEEHLASSPHAEGAPAEGVRVPELPRRPPATSGPAPTAGIASMCLTPSRSVPNAVPWLSQRGASNADKKARSRHGVRPPDLEQI